MNFFRERIILLKINSYKLLNPMIIFSVTAKVINYKIILNQNSWFRHQRKDILSSDYIRNKMKFQIFPPKSRKENKCNFQNVGGIIIVLLRTLGPLSILFMHFIISVVLQSSNSVSCMYFQDSRKVSFL